MAITEVTFNGTPITTGATAWNVTIPAAAVPGDVMILMPTTSLNTSVLSSVTSGITPVIALAQSPSANVTSGVYYYVIPDPKPATITFTWSANQTGSMAYYVARGVDTASPVNASAVTTWGSSAWPKVVASITTTVADCFILGGVHQGSGSATITPPGTWTTKVNSTTRRGYMAIKGIQSAAGASGTASFSSTSTTTDGRAWQLALRPAGVPATPTNTYCVVGDPRPDGFTISTKTVDAVSVRVKVATDSALTTGVVYGTSATPDSSGWCKSVVTGLSSFTRYYYGVEMTNAASAVTTTAFKGRPWTMPAVGASLTNFKVAWGSCFDSYDGALTSPLSGSFARILARDPQLFFHVGDFAYADNASSSQASHLADLERELGLSSALADLLANVATVYVKSDHDGDANESGVGVWTTPNRNAAKQIFPYPTLADANGLYCSLVVGKIRFIFTDSRSYPVHFSTKLGATQKAWLKSEFEQPEPLKIWIQDSVWIDNEPGNETDNDSWASVPAERTEIGNHWTTNGVGELICIHGDQHAISADDGSHNSWGGFPTMCAAPFRNASSIKVASTTDWSAGVYPTTDGVESSQYGVLTLDEASSNIATVMRAYDASNTQRVTMTVNAAVSESHSGSLTLSGSGTQTRAGSPGVSTTQSLSGSGTLTRSGVPTTSSSLGFSGSGTLVQTAAPGISTSLELSGSGTQTRTPVSATASGTLGLSGSGTLSRSVAGVTSSGTLGLSGSGTLSQSGSSSTSGSIAMSGSGTQSRSVSSVTASGSRAMSGSGGLELTGTATEHASGSLSLSGSGTLARTGVPGATSPLALSGSGELDLDVVTMSATGTLTRTGSGTFLAAGEGDEVGAGTLERTGSGTMSATAVAIATSGSVSLSGFGNLGLSGAGAEDGEGSTGLSGSGTLTLSGRVGTSGSVSTNGSGLLGLEGKISVQSGLSRAGSGTLTLVGEGTVGEDGAVSFSGSGTLSLVGTSTASGQLLLSGAGALARQVVQLVLSGALSLDGDGTLALTRRGAVQVPSVVSLEALPYTIELVAQESGDHDVVEIEEGGRVMLIVKHGDTHEVSWKTNLDLTGATVRMFFRRKTSRTGEPEHAATEVDSYIINAVDGVVGHTLTGDLVVADYDVEVQATIDGQVISAPNNDYELMRVEKDLM